MEEEEEDTELAAAIVFRVAVANGSPPDGTVNPRCRAASTDITYCKIRQDFKFLITTGTKVWKVRSCSKCCSDDAIACNFIHRMRAIPSGFCVIPIYQDDGSSFVAALFYCNKQKERKDDLKSLLL
mmetsp:Transcript_478/g.519  ORF Transcript_478/g.519 Transcript_478/m.519 type:complete len:126 (-) Transcript_478:7-384(-)